jgi:hypothetical protein
MPTSIEEIKEFLDAEKLKYHHREGANFLHTGFTLKRYRNPEKENRLRLFIAVEEQGEFIKIGAPGAYKFNPNGNSFNKLALFQTLLQISHMTKMAQFEYDPDDGDIQAIVEFPLEDSKLTRRQLMRCVNDLTDTVDNYHEHIMDAIKGGLTPESESQTKIAFDEFMRKRRVDRRREFGDEPESPGETSA